MRITTEGSALPKPPDPEGKKKGKWRKPLNKEHRDARAGLIMASKLANKRTEDICAEFNLSRATVYRALSDARKMGLLTQARDWLTLTTMPLALAAIEEGLRHGELPLKVDTAFRVLDVMGISGKHAILTFQGGEGGESFESFRAEIVKRVTLTHQHANATETSRPGGDADPGPGVYLGDPGSTVEVTTEAVGAGSGEDCLPGSDSGDYGGDRGVVADGVIEDDDEQM